MKTKIFVITLLVIWALTSCNKPDDLADNDAPLAILSVESDGTSVLTRANITPLLDVTLPLTADEIEFLYAIREDEKVARDLYLAFSAKYPTAAQISKIAAAEGSHITCVEAVLDYYEIEYPALGANGVFEDVARQALYDELSDKSSTLVEAFSTMALVEEETIFAYKSVQGKITNTNLSLIVANMIKASSNHLRAAVRQVTALGESYVPSYLTTEEFNIIINSAFQCGNVYAQQKGKGGQGGNTNAQKGNQGQGHKNSINASGDCTGIGNNSASGQNQNGGVGKGYRGGR